MTITRTYENGGCKVIMKPDGTKIRYGENPQLPESIDFKITDYCDKGCRFCHEKSTIHGRHGNSQFFYKVVSQMIRGTELAIGGGNPLDHPELEDYLKYCRASGIYANLTINYDHIVSDYIKSLIERRLVAGIGISAPEASYNIPDQVYKLYCRYPERIVFHLIAGIHSPQYLINLQEQFKNPKVLLLGYKTFGFGKKYGSLNQNQIERKLDSWREIQKCAELFSKINNCHLSFDNLAVKQLEVGKIWPDKFEKHYMGADGKYTMYIDGVTKRFAVGSTCVRQKCNNSLLSEMFEKVKFSS